MNIEFINSKEKKRILEKLNDEFGINELPYLLIETGKEKIRGFSGTMTRDEIKLLGELARIEIIGAYLFKEENGALRLSLDGIHILGKQIGKSIIEISEKELDKWIRGENLEIEHNEEQGMYIVKNNNDFLGCGKWNGKVLINFVPKERRIRKN